MKQVTIYTDGSTCYASVNDVPTRSRRWRNRSGMTTSAVGKDLP